jgi:hypothetical protein
LPVNLGQGHYFDGFVRTDHEGRIRLGKEMLRGPGGCDESQGECAEAEEWEECSIHGKFGLVKGFTDGAKCVFYRRFAITATTNEQCCKKMDIIRKRG